MTSTSMYRQGDVMLVCVDEMPADVTAVKRDGGRVVLAYGEVTGHAHAIAEDRAALFLTRVAAEVDRHFLRVDGNAPVALMHAEHATVMVPPGVYQVRRQREYQPDAIRVVAD